jgi:hypothetical protein
MRPLENPEHGPMPGICCSCDERRAADSIHFTAFSIHVTDPLFSLDQVLICSRGPAPRNAGPQIGRGGPECCVAADVRGSLLPACLPRSIVIQTQSHFHVLTAALRHDTASSPASLHLNYSLSRKLNPFEEGGNYMYHLL